MTQSSKPRAADARSIGGLVRLPAMPLGGIRTIREGEGELPRGCVRRFRPWHWCALRACSPEGGEHVRLAAERFGGMRNFSEE